MIRLFQYILSFGLIMTFLSACTHIEKVKPPSVIPEITLISTSPGTVKAHEDEILFNLEYTDGDGDLGTNDDKIRNVFVTDNRINVVHEFRLKQLAPDDANVPITGTFEIILPNTILVGNSGSEAVTFTIKVVDRAGNESNEVTSPELTVVQ